MFTPNPADMFPGAHLADVLDTALVPVNKHPFNRHFTVDGYPDVYVRKNSGLYDVDRDVAESRTAFAALSDYGISSLPFIPVVHRGIAHILTHKVAGVPLTDELRPGQPTGFIDSVDQEYAKWADYIVDVNTTGKTYANDVTGPQQYMVGSTVSEPDVKLRMVDLDIGVLAGSPVWIDDEAVSLANWTVDAENKLQARLPLARTGTYRMLEGIQVDTDYTAAIVRLGHLILENGTPIGDYEDWGPEELIRRTR